MKRLTMLVLLSCFVGTVFPAMSKESGDEKWVLVVDDRFDRKEAGKDWIPYAIQEKTKPQCVLKDGAFYVTGLKTGFYYRQPIFGNVKVVYKARWSKEVGRSIVQFGNGFYCDFLYPNRTGIYAVHGKYSNTTNSVMLYSSQRVFQNKAPLPEPGDEAEMESSVEDGVITLKRDGKTILSYPIPDKLKYKSGGYVYFPCNEDFLQYERIRIYRQAEVPAVPAKFDFAAADPELKKHMEELSRLPLDADNGEWLKGLNALAGILSSRPGARSKTAEGELGLEEIVSLLIRVIRTDFGRRLGFAGYLDRHLDPSHPLADKFYFEYGRAKWANAQENRNGIIFEDARRTFRRVGRDCPTVRMYLGENVPWGEELLNGMPEDAPRWARLQCEARKRYFTVIDWWVANRQTKRGDLGGGWGDDVEILRVWGPLITASQGNGAAFRGMKKLIDGAWRYADKGLELGYSKRIGDVEHSAEPSSDTQPLMLLFAPRDPEYVRRNLLLHGLCEKLWTKRNSAGRRYFLSPYMSALEVDASPQRQCSVPYHIRAIKGLNFLVWSGDYPDTVKLLLELGEGWRFAVMAEKDGKISGIVPAAVSFEGERIGGLFGDWFDPKLDWSYFRFDRGNSFRIYDFLVNCYVLSGDARFAEPVLLAASLGAEQPRAGAAAEAKEKSREYQLQTLGKWFWGGDFVPVLARIAFAGHDAETAARAEKLMNSWQSGGVQTPGGVQRPEKTLLAGPEAQYNAYKNHVARYRMTGDVREAEALYDAALKNMRINLPMFTSEMMQTDRVSLPGAVETYLLMTGAFQSWGDAAFPTHFVTVKHPNQDFAVLSRRTGQKSAEMKFYHFDRGDEKFRFEFYDLPDGEYVFSGPDGETGFTVSGRRGVLERRIPAGQTMTFQISEKTK